MWAWVDERRGERLTDVLVVDDARLIHEDAPVKIVTLPVRRPILASL